MDRVNIAGNETGQQSNFASKGSSRYDTVWTMDGVVITDMSATGGSPTYFDFDAFQEIQIATSGQSLKQQTGGAGLNFVVKSGTNQYRGTARGYFTGDGLEASNVPDELAAIGVTPETANHNDQISDYGFDLGGPILREPRLGVGLVDEAGHPPHSIGRRNLVDRTILKTYNMKGTWQAAAERHDQRALVQRREAEVRPRHRRRAGAGADRDLEPGQPLSGERARTGCSSSRTTTCSRRPRSCRRSMRTTAPASASSRPAGWTVRRRSARGSDRRSAPRGRCASCGRRRS